jgi:hypothetical protein
MELSKEQTLELIVNINKRNSIARKYSFTTKFKWKCLGCMDTIYIRYDSCGRQAIFCPSCFSKVQQKPTIAQFQYMRRLKEQQLKFVDTYINDFLDTELK